MELRIGSNSFRNTNGVLTLQGKEQVVLELPAHENQLLLTMDFYDAAGLHIAHLRRNSWAFNYKDRFEISTGPATLPLFREPTWLKVLDKETGAIAFEARAEGKNQVQVPRAQFHTHKGQLVEITSHLCRLGGAVTLFGEVSDLRGGAVPIG